MAYGTGENLQHLWHTMDAPQRVGTCTKLRQGQLLMQRYKYCHEQFQGHVTYGYQSVSAKEKAIKLAALMVAHAEQCTICCNDKVLEEALFYGVYK